MSLNWIDSTSFEDGFIIERSTESHNYQEIGRVDKNIASFLDVNVDTNFSYSYRVRAFTELNVSEPSDSININFLPEVIQRIEIPSPGVTIQRFLFHPSGEVLAVSEYLANAIKLYSVETGAYIRTLININTVFDFSPDGQLYACNNSGTIEIRD
ncbi:MAG: fibronectin type III domain-containing protein, partial [Enhygromyxa sp.]